MAVTGLLAWFGGVGAAAQAHNVPKVALLALIGGCMCWQYPFHRSVLKNNVKQRMIRPST
jgi:hypothetical protein